MTYQKKQNKKDWITYFCSETIFPSAAAAAASVKVRKAHAAAECIFTFLHKNPKPGQTCYYHFGCLPSTTYLMPPSLPGMGPVSRLWPEIAQDLRLPLLTPLICSFINSSLGLKR